MTDKIAIWLAWGNVISSIFPILFFYKSWKNLVRSPYIFIAIYFSVKVLLNSLSAILYYSGLTLPFNISPFFTFNGNLFLMTFFYLAINKYKNINISIIILCFFFHIYLFYFLDKIGDFEIGLVLTSVIFTALSILLLRQISERNFGIRLTKNPSFWFSVALLISVLPSIFTQLLGNLLKDFNNNFPYSILLLSNLFAIISNIFYAIGVFRLSKLNNR